MTDFEEQAIEAAKAELIKRGVDPAEIAQAEAEGKALTLAQKKQWKASTRKHLQENRRYPLKLKETPDSSDVLMVDNGDPTDTICQVFQTTGFLDHSGGAHLLSQAIHASGQENNARQANATISMMNGIEPQNALEGLLAAQMATCHNMAMAFSKRAMREGQSTEAVDRNINRASKLMRTFTAQVDALQKLRNKGQQRITVQHVQVGNGGQAVIGDVHQGGGTRG